MARKPKPPVANSVIAEPVADKARKRREAFVAEYLVDLNATQAALRAGIGTTNTSAAVEAGKLLRNPYVKDLIDKQFRARLERIELSQDKVIQELAIIAMSDILDYEVNEHTGRLVPIPHRRVSRAVQSVKIKRRTWEDRSGSTQSEVITEIKLWDKTKAIELLMRHMGMLDDDSGTRKESLTPDERRTRAAAGLARLLEQRRADLN